MSTRPLAFTTTFALLSFATSAHAGPFRLTTIDIGQGDAIAVVAPSGCAALLDGGGAGSGPEIKAYLSSIGVTGLDFAIVSHYHADHIGGIDEVELGTGAIPIGVVYDRGGSYSSATYTEYATQFAGRRSTVVVGQTISLCGEVTFRVEAANANGTGSTDENARSVAVRVSWQGVDALVGGDLTGGSPDIESLIAPSVGELEIYKIHHHGSRTSSNQTFLDATRPTVALVSASWNNSYGHPHVETVQRLEAVGSSIWRTSIYQQGALGDIQIASTDGASFTVQQGATSQTYLTKGAPLPDTLPPTAPASLVATASPSTIDLTWAPSSDDVGVTSYRVDRSADGTSFAPVATASGTSLTEGGLAAGTTYSYQVFALDAASNVSAGSNIASATTPAAADTTAPSPPASLVAAGSANAIDLAWGASTDATGVTSYEVWRAGSFLTSLAAASLAYRDAGLAADTTHSYQVTAVDAAGNRSLASAAATGTTFCTVNVTLLKWTSTSKLLTVRATSSKQPGATLSLVVNGQNLGSMTWSASRGYYEKKVTLTAKPACVTVTSSCGGEGSRCF